MEVGVSDAKKKLFPLKPDMTTVTEQTHQARIGVTLDGITFES